MTAGFYAGANIEVISFPEGWCAETTAIGHMIMAGGRRIREVAVIAEKLELCPPCGGCRQRLAEFADADTLVHLCDAEGIRQTLRMDELLPHRFQDGGDRMSTVVDVLTDRFHGLMPRHALVLGSGLGSLVETVADPVRIPMATCLDFPKAGCPAMPVKSWRG
jgi:homotetrameric cytidine deaminase